MRLFIIFFIHLYLISETFSSSHKDFFDSHKMYYIRIKNWPPHLIPAPGSKEDYQEAQDTDAILEIHRTDPSSKAHCPDLLTSSETLLHQTHNFKIRLGGNMTKWAAKSSYKIKMKSSQDYFLDMPILNLKSMWNDPSQMREALAWKLFDLAHLVAPQHTYAKLCINDRYFGLYSLIEEVDEAFLKKNFPNSPNGNLYKANWVNEDLGAADLSYQKDSTGDDSGRQYFRLPPDKERTYQLKTNEENEKARLYDDFAFLIKIIHGKEKPQENFFNSSHFSKKIESHFNVKSFLRWAAVNNLLGSWDNYWATPSNYFLYNGGLSLNPSNFYQEPFFTWIPWDYDNSFGISYWKTEWQYASIINWSESTWDYHGGKIKPIPLIENLFLNKDYLTYYLDFMEYFIHKFFHSRWIQHEANSLWDHIQQAVWLEANSPHCTHTFPFPCAHTGRQFSNHEVYAQGKLQEEIHRPGVKALGIYHFVKMRSSHALKQIAKLRPQYPKQYQERDFKEDSF